MSVTHPMLLPMILLVFSQALGAQTQGLPDRAALASAESFLQLLDEGKWLEAYGAGQFTVDFSLFEELIVRHRIDRGAHSARQFLGEKPRLGSTRDETVKKTELQFETMFEDGIWTESIILTTGGGGPWFVEGYTIGHRRSG